MSHVTILTNKHALRCLLQSKTPFLTCYLLMNEPSRKICFDYTKKVNNPRRQKKNQLIFVLISNTNDLHDLKIDFIKLFWLRTIREISKRIICHDYFVRDYFLFKYSKIQLKMFDKRTNQKHQTKGIFFKFRKVCYMDECTIYNRNSILLVLI